MQLQCIQLPEILEQRLGSRTGNSQTPIACAHAGATGNPKVPNFSRPVRKRFLETLHVRPPAMRKVGILLDVALQQRRSALSPK